MRFTTGPLFATLALAAYLPSILATGELDAGKGSLAVLKRELANNGTAGVNGTEEVDVGQGEGDDNQDENANEEGDANDQENADDEDQNQDNKDDENNEDGNNDKNNGDNLDGINIDENDVEGSLLQNIGNLMLLLGICDFNIGSISNIGIGNQIQLLLQLQQLQQLQQLGIVNSFSIEQLLQQGVLLNNFDFNVIKRTVSASVKQAAREKKRNIAAVKQC